MFDWTSCCFLITVWTSETWFPTSASRLLPPVKPQLTAGSYDQCFWGINSEAFFPPITDGHEIFFSLLCAQYISKNLWGWTLFWSLCRMISGKAGTECLCDQLTEWQHTDNTGDWEETVESEENDWDFKLNYEHRRKGVHQKQQLYRQSVSTACSDWTLPDKTRIKEAKFCADRRGEKRLGN